jgi:DNA-nicking Smr family endonuclease
MEAEKKEKSFVIKDKRIFDESGDVRKETETPTQEKPLETKAEKAQQPPVEESQEPPTEEYLPEMNFANFVLSLSTTAMYHFGDFPDPVSRKAEKNLIAAKQTIDILGLLQTKTEGNLDENEKSLLDGLLFELRMRYVKEKGSP